MRSDQTPSGSHRRAFFFVQSQPADFRSIPGRPHLAPECRSTIAFDAVQHQMAAYFRCNGAPSLSTSTIQPGFQAITQFRHKKRTKETNS